MNERAIRAKILFGFELTEQEKAFYLLFMASSEQLAEYLRNS